jgi:hypothetical protein
MMKGVPKWISYLCDFPHCVAIFSRAGNHFELIFLFWNFCYAGPTCRFLSLLAVPTGLPCLKRLCPSVPLQLSERTTTAVRAHRHRCPSAPRRRILPSPVIYSTAGHRHLLML